MKGSEQTSPTITSSARRANVWKHAFVYFWLVIAVLSALTGDSLSSVGVVGSLALLAVLGSWYGYWYIHVPAAGERDVDSRVYLVGALVIWALLVAIDPGFVIVGVSVAASRCFDDLRWALALLVPCAAAWLWQSATAGDLGWSEAAIAALFLASGATVVGYTRTLASQNTERQRLIDQLEATQNDLAAAERLA